MWAVGFIIIGYILYGIYWVIINYWPFILAGVLSIWILPRIAKFIFEQWMTYQRRLRQQKERECSQNDLFSRFCDKDVVLISFGRLYPILSVICLVLAYYTVFGIQIIVEHEDWINHIPEPYRPYQYFVWVLLFFFILVTTFKMIISLINKLRPNREIFVSYKNLLKHAHTAQNSVAALEYAPSIKEAAKFHVRSLYDIFVATHALFSRNHHTSYYKSERLRDALNHLETNFPHVHDDESFRRRYWNYARHIYKLLDFREDQYIEDSLFAQPYPESEKFKQQEARENLKRERAKYQNEPQDVWSKQVDMITLNDALELVGMKDVPPVTVLHKLHIAVLEDHKDDPKKAKLTARAFELLGAQAVKNEMS